MAIYIYFIIYFSVGLIWTAIRFGSAYRIAKAIHKLRWFPLACLGEICFWPVSMVLTALGRLVLGMKGF